jgi:hypothetical protein
MAPSKTPALAFNHVGLTVPDIFAAIDWYGKVFEATHIMDLVCLRRRKRRSTKRLVAARAHCTCRRRKMDHSSGGNCHMSPLWTCRGMAWINRPA